MAVIPVKTETCRVVAALRPFGLESIERELPAPVPIAEVLREIGATRPVLGYNVSLNEQPVPPELWQETLALPGDVVGVRAVPRGGGGGDSGKDALSIILGIAALAAGPTGAALLAKNVGGLFAKTFVKHMVGGLISYGATATVNSLAPPPEEEKDTPDVPVFNEENLLDPYARIYRVFGKVPVYMQMPARPFIDTKPEDNPTSLGLYHIHGPARLANVTVNGIRIEDIDDAEWEIFSGLEGEGGTRYSHDDLTGQAVSERTILPPLIVEGEPDEQLEEDQWSSTQLTATGTHELFVSATFPNGVGAYIDSRKLWSVGKINLEVQVKVDGVTDGWHTLGVRQVKAASGEQFTKSYRFPLVGEVPALGGGTVDEPQQWEVRVKRGALIPSTGEGIEYTPHDTTIWTALRSMRWEDPVKNEFPTATLGVRLPASYANELNRVRCEVTSYLKWFNGSSWQDYALEDALGNPVYNNPAWCFAEWMTGVHNPAAITHSKLHTDSIGTHLAGWAKDCIDKGYSFNYCFRDGKPVDEGAQFIASLGMASVRRFGSKYGVVQDESREGQAPRMTFTARNSHDFEIEKVQVQPVHAIVIDYEDEADDWTQAELYVYLPGYNQGNAEKFERRKLPGCTNEALAKIHGERLAKVRQFRSISYRLRTSLSWLRCSRGDLAGINHDAAIHGLGSARVRERIAPAGQPTFTKWLVLDSGVTFEAGESYILGGTLSDGSHFSPRAITGDPGDQTTVEFAVAVPNSQAPDVGDVVFWGYASGAYQRAVITEVMPDDDWKAELRLVPEDPGYYAPGVYQTFKVLTSSRPSLRNTPPAKPVVQAVQSDEYVLHRRQDGSFESRIVLTLSYEPPFDPETGEPLYTAPIDHVVVQYRRSPEGEEEPESWQTMAPFSGPVEHVHCAPVLDGELYDVRLRAFSAHSVASEWTLEETIEVIGQQTPPPPPENLSLEGQTIRWSYPDDDNRPIDFRGFQARIHAGYSADPWEDGTPMYNGRLTANTFLPLPTLQAGTYTIMVRARDYAGNWSEEYAAIEVTLSGAEKENIDSRYTTDHRAQGWDWDFGAYQNGTIIGGDLVPTSSGMIYNRLIYEASFSYPVEQEYSDATPIVFLDISVTGAHTYRVEYKPVHFAVGHFSEDGWLPWPGSAPMYIRNQVGAYDFAEFGFRIIVAAQPQSEGRPAVTACIHYLGFPTMTEQTEMILPHPVFANYCPFTKGFTRFTRAAAQPSGEPTDPFGACKAQNLNPGGGNGPLFRGYTLSGSGDLKFDVELQGYRSIGGPE